MGENQQNVTSAFIPLPSSSFHVVKPLHHTFQYSLHLFMEDILQVQSSTSPILDTSTSGYVDICFVEMFTLECQEMDSKALNIDNCLPSSRSSRPVAFSLSQSPTKTDWIGLLPLSNSVKVFVKKRA